MVAHDQSIRILFVEHYVFADIAQVFLSQINLLPNVIFNVLRILVSFQNDEVLYILNSLDKLFSCHQCDVPVALTDLL